jgi:hypothetical protein
VDSGQVYLSAFQVRLESKLSFDRAFRESRGDGIIPSACVIQVQRGWEWGNGTPGGDLREIDKTREVRVGQTGPLDEFLPIRGTPYV